MVRTLFVTDGRFSKSESFKLGDTGKGSQKWALPKTEKERSFFFQDKLNSYKQSY